jgi:hypothetical protein
MATMCAGVLAWLVVLLLGSSDAWATSIGDPTELDTGAVLTTYGSHGGMNLVVSLDGGTPQPVWAKELDASLDDGDVVRHGFTYSIEVGQVIPSMGTIPDVTIVDPSSSWGLMQAAYLLDTWHGVDVDLKEKFAIAALQLAIWEVVYDSEDLGLDGGHFAVVGAAAHVRDLAGLMLDSIPSDIESRYTTSYIRGVLHPVKRDQIFVAIPEPSLMLLVLLGAGATSLRRGSRA